MDVVIKIIIIIIIVNIIVIVKIIIIIINMTRLETPTGRRQLKPVGYL